MVQQTFPIPYYRRRRIWPYHIATANTSSNIITWTRAAQMEVQRVHRQRMAITPVILQSIIGHQTVTIEFKSIFETER